MYIQSLTIKQLSIMAVFREGYQIIEQIADSSVRIFDDACDFGAPIKPGDPLWVMLKQLIEWYGVEGTRIENRWSTGRSVEAEIELMDEWAVSDGRKTESEATDRFHIMFVSCNEGKCKGKEGYVTAVKI